MEYLLMQTRDGYLEYPVFGRTKEYTQGHTVIHAPYGAGGLCPTKYEKDIWQIRDGRQVFWLCGERRLFARKACVTISEGTEALLRIPGLKSRFYIRGMQMCAETNGKERLYLNQQELNQGDFVLQPGDVLFLENVKIEVWEKQIAVQGNADAYQTKLLECFPLQKPEGFPIYKRSPRLLKRPSAEKIRIELPREKETGAKKGFLMVILPPLAMTAVALAIGLLAGHGIYLLLSAAAAGMTAVFSGVQYVDERREQKKRDRERRERYIGYLWHRQKEIAIACEREQEIYDFQYPTVEELGRMIRAYDSRIYERSACDEDFLTVAVGSFLGGTRLQIEGKEQAWDVKGDALAELAEEILRRYSLILRPRVVDLKKAHLGMIGERETVQRQMNVLIMQLAFFHSYHDLRMIVVYDERYEETFAWMRWLPHLRIPAMNVLGMVCSERTQEIVLGGMAQILKERAEQMKEGVQGGKNIPYYLFLIDEPSWILNHGIMEYLCMDGKKLGFSIIYASYTQANLPEYIGSVLVYDSSSKGTLLLDEQAYTEQEIRLFSGDKVDFEWMARDLSVLEHARGTVSFIPRNVSFFELYGIRRPDELDVRKRWKENQSHKSLAVPLGMRMAGEVLCLNLHERAHGPHGLVAGTTGAGKSELLQTYILSLAVNFHPYEVGFLLIDYKGGGMANLFCDLPHHMGTITNLDGPGSMRALISVKAELSRRQRIFRSFQVNHINGYMRLFREGAAPEPIPHLFIISDEFAELKKEQPDFMKELVSVSRIGRSLGVHLILATQKPAGVVDEQIISNSKFKLCLKVQNESDSKEILKTGDAAGLTLPGRAYFQVGNHEIYELFQSAFSGEAYREEEKNESADNQVYAVNKLGQGELFDQDLSKGAEESRACKTQLEAVIAHIQEEFTKEEVREVKKPWLLPLGKMIVSPYGVKDRRKDNKLSVRIGRVDLPEMQEQKELEHNFENEGNLFYAASAGFGKTVFLTTVLTSLAISCDVDTVHFYILDYGNHGCMPMKELPHTAEYISPADEERYWKFKKFMTDEIASRKKLFAEYAAPSLEAYRELSGDSLKSLVVAIDQFDVVKEVGFEEEDFFTRLTRDGAGLGIYTVVTVARVNAVRQATLINFKKRIAGYIFESNETCLTVGRTTLKQTDIKGRVLVSGEYVHEAQIYTMAPCEDKVEYSRALKNLIQEVRKSYPGKEAPHIPVLPQELYSDMMKEYASDGSGYLIGLDVEEVVGTGFQPTAGMFVIIGNTGTGKTNMLKILANQAIPRERTYLFDTKGMEMYYCRQAPNVLYIEGKKEIEIFVKEMSKELEDRRMYLKKRLRECDGLSPKELLGELPFCTILIDDLEDFTEKLNTDLERITYLIKEGISLGIPCIITIHAAKPRGMSGMDKLVRQASEGLVLSSQGVVPIFPVSGMREIPKPGEGLLFKNGVYRRVRLPKYGHNLHSIVGN